MRRCSRDEVLCKRQQIDKFSHLFILASLNLVFDWACVVYSRMSNEAKMMTTSNSAPENTPRKKSRQERKNNNSPMGLLCIRNF
jgi:hypothetical protein